MVNGEVPVVCGDERRSGGRPRANATNDPIPVALTRETKIVVDLQPKPGFRRNAYYVASVMSNVISGKAAPTQLGVPPEASVEKCGVLENRSAARPAGRFRVSDLEAVLSDPTF